MDVRVASLEREVDPSEDWREVVNEAKALTWTFGREHALNRVEPERLLLVRGGADGIAFEADGDAVFVIIDGERCHVTHLAWHTHPRPTGPSNHDRDFLRVLKQRDSLIFEMFGDRNGTRFVRKGEEGTR